MSNQQNDDLHNRLDRLEEKINSLERAFRAFLAEKSVQPGKSETVAPPPAAEISPKKQDEKPEFEAVPATDGPASAQPEPQPVAPTQSTTAPVAKPRSRFASGEYWLNRIGIWLLLLGVVFLFKYSVDQGWLTPWVRIAVGLLVGSILLYFGFRVRGRRRFYSQLFTGGGVAAYYITGFAAFQLLHLVAFGVAMVFMTIVTALAFLISIRQDTAILSLIGAIGGLGTPFLLYSQSGSIPGLVSYTCLILIGSTLVYLFKGWRSLLVVSALGGWTVMILALLDLQSPEKSQAMDKWAVQVAYLFGLFAFWGVPVLRERLRIRNPEKWTLPEVTLSKLPQKPSTGSLYNLYPYLFAVLAPIVTHLFSYAIWGPSDTVWGTVLIAGAVLFGVVALYLYKEVQLLNLAHTHRLVALYLFTVGLAFLFDGNALFIALATEAALVRTVGARVQDRGLAIAGHVLFGIVFLWLLDRIQFTQVTVWIEALGVTPFLNARALADLWAIVLMTATAGLGQKETERSVYLILAAVALAGLLVRELGGNWQFIAVVTELPLLHWYGRKLKDISLRNFGHAFFAVVFVWMMTRLLLPSASGSAVFNWQTLADMYAIAIIFVTSRMITGVDAPFAYRLGVHVGILALMWRELGRFEDGQGYVSIAWGVYAIALLLIGLQMDRRKLQTVALATLFLLVGKLFFVDLANLQAIWRILLFIGFGALFLFISYYFRSLWRQKDESAEEEAAP